MVLEGNYLRNNGKLVLWPAYFDTDLSWRDGRRVSKNLSLRAVKADEIYKVTEELNLNPIINEKAAFSKMPWRKNGMVIIKKTGKKSDIIKNIARKMRINRTRK